MHSSLTDAQMDEDVPKTPITTKMEGDFETGNVNTKQERDTLWFL